MKETPEQQLLRDLIRWQTGETLTPLLNRAADLLGDEAITDLPVDTAYAREKLIDAVELRISETRPDS